MRAPTAGRTVEPRRESGTGPGRPYRPPLHAPAAVSCCRGALYMRPCCTAGIGGLSVIATRSWRHVGMPPYARSGQGTALHARAGGPMGASAPTMGGVRCTRGQRTRNARPYGGQNHRTPAGIGNRSRAAIQAAPTGAPAAVFGCRGGLYGRPGRTAGIGGLSVIAARSWRHVGMPPYEVRRECGNNPKPIRAAASRPYDAPPPRSVGRGAHTPPNQAAGIAGFYSHRSPVRAAIKAAPTCTRHRFPL